MKIVAVGAPKGGVAKTTTAVTVAAIAGRSGLRTLLVDCDDTRSATEWVQSSGDRIPVEVADGRDLAALRRLRHAGGFDLAVVDLPGAREGAFAAILRGDDGRPVADLLVSPCGPELLELRPTVRTIIGEVIPLGLPHMIVFTRVLSVSLPRAIERGSELRRAGLTVARTPIRRYAAFDEAIEMGMTVLDLGGSHSYARAAESDYASLTDEILTALDMKD